MNRYDLARSDDDHCESSHAAIDGRGASTVDHEGTSDGWSEPTSPLSGTQPRRELDNGVTDLGICSSTAEVESGDADTLLPASNRYARERDYHQRRSPSVGSVLFHVCLFMATLLGYAFVAPEGYIFLKSTPAAHKQHVLPVAPGLAVESSRQTTLVESTDGIKEAEAMLQRGASCKEANISNENPPATNGFGKIVLVTGAAGFIGSHVARYCAATLRMKVVAVDDLSGGHRENVAGVAGVTFFVGDVKDVTFLRSLFDAYEFFAVYHIAAYAAEGLSHFIRSYNYRNNLVASAELLNMAVKSGVECFVFTSSIAVYGAGQTPMTETTQPVPEDPYGIAKYAFELDLAAAKRVFGIDHVIFRPHNVYGPGQEIHDKYRNVIGIFFDQLLKGEPLTVFGDGEQVRAFTYIDDVAPIIAQAPLVPRARNQVFNLGAEQTYTVNQLAKEVIRAMDAKDVQIKHLPPRKEVFAAFSDHSKVRCYFSPQPPISLREGLDITSRWIVGHGISRSPPLGFDSVEVVKGMPSSWVGSGVDTMGEVDRVAHERISTTSAGQLSPSSSPSTARDPLIREAAIQNWFRNERGKILERNRAGVDHHDSHAESLVLVATECNGRDDSASKVLVQRSILPLLQLDERKSRPLAHVGLACGRTVAEAWTDAFQRYMRSQNHGYVHLILITRGATIQASAIDMLIGALKCENSSLDRQGSKPNAWIIPSSYVNDNRQGQHGGGGESEDGSQSNGHTDSGEECSEYPTWSSPLDWTFRFAGSKQLAPIEALDQRFAIAPAAYGNVWVMAFDLLALRDVHASLRFNELSGKAEVVVPLSFKTGVGTRREVMVLPGMRHLIARYAPTSWKTRMPESQLYADDLPSVFQKGEDVGWGKHMAMDQEDEGEVENMSKDGEVSFAERRYLPGYNDFTTHVMESDEIDNSNLAVQSMQGPASYSNATMSQVEGCPSGLVPSTPGEWDTFTSQGASSQGLMPPSRHHDNLRENTSLCTAPLAPELFRDHGQWSFELDESGRWDCKHVPTHSLSRNGGCELPSVSHTTARRCLSGKSIVFIGDSLMRYQYLSLAHFLLRGEWGPPMPSANQDKPLEMEGLWSSWEKFFADTNARLGGTPTEICDCFRDGVRGPRSASDSIENRYLWLDNPGGALRTRLSFILWNGRHPIRGNYVPSSKPIDPDCTPGHCSRARWQAYGPNWVGKALRSIVTPLEPDVIMLNTGNWWDPRSDPDLVLLGRIFDDALKVVRPHNGKVIWKTTTQVRGSSSANAKLRNDRVVRLALSKNISVFDAFSFTKGANHFTWDRKHFFPFVYRYLNQAFLVDYGCTSAP